MRPSLQPLVSIVTPAHNEVALLAECIESVIAQTYQNWDYTIVDNCSTDGTVEVARLYAAEDSRIRIVENKQFLPAIPNHNTAVRHISPASKYCKVVLADDWIFPECLKSMVTVAEAHPSVGIVGAYSLEGTRVSLAGLPHTSTLTSGREICRRTLLEKLYVFGSATSLLFRSDLVRMKDPFFNEANIHADTEVCFRLLRSCDFGFVHQVLTYTRVRPESITAVGNDIQTSFAAMLQILNVYGPAFLTPQELATLLDECFSSYYRFLGKSLILGRDHKFWDYHKAKLREVGRGFSTTRLMRAVFAIACDALLNPKDTIERLRTGKGAERLGDGKRDLTSKHLGTTF